jgi:serine protease Do
VLRLSLPVLLALLVPTLAPRRQVPQAGIDAALSAVYPSLVRISVVTVGFGGGREVRSEAFGSGTIVSADGYVVTNHHVAGHARRVTCTLATEEDIPADVVGSDALSDITVLKLRPPSPRTFPAASFGDSTRLRRGEPVLALGSPLALSQSVTMGIVSNLDMVLGGSFSLDGEDVGSIVRWIGHDAAIYPGNSGGPLIDLRGRIVGVNELSYGLAAAIPAEIVKPVVKALIDTGHVTRGWIGLDVQPRLTTQRDRGALVAWVARHSPADAAGLRSGDLLVGVAGEPIDAAYLEQVPLVNLRIAQLAPGRPVEVEILRDGRRQRLTVTPAERQPAIREPRELRAWGIVAADLTEPDARERGRDSTAGVLVASLRAGGAAQQAKPPIEPGDVIVGIDGAAVADTEALRQVTSKLLDKQDRASALVAVDRDKEHRLSVIELSLPRTEAPPLEARKSWLPLESQTLTPPLAARLGVAGRTGVRVTRVIDATLPLRVGDLILAVDGEPVRASGPGDEAVFAAMLRPYAAGSQVPLTIVRDGAEQTVTAVVQTAPALASEMPRYENADFGFRAREMSDRDLDEMDLSDATRGVMVDSVEPGGWAALARLQTGDVILTADGEPAATIGALEARLKAAAAARAASVVLRVRRGLRTLFVEIEPAWNQ